jgi:RNA polymerase sigma-70 factor (ECF subfamily)
MIPYLLTNTNSSHIAPALAQPSWNGRVNSNGTYSWAERDLTRCDRDAELMLRVRDGDAGSFGILLEKHRGPIFHLLCRMVQNEAVAEELSQEVFLRVFKSRGSYIPTAKFTTWVYRIATHLALNWIRDGRSEKSQTSLDEETANGAGRQVPDRHRTVEQELLHQAKLREVREAIQRLPSKQRAAVMMHKYRDMEYAQIAGAIGCSESAVKSLLFRAYEALRVRLAHLA